MHFSTGTKSIAKSGNENKKDSRPPMEINGKNGKIIKDVIFGKDVKNGKLVFFGKLASKQKV